MRLRKKPALIAGAGIAVTVAIAIAALLVIRTNAGPVIYVGQGSFHTVVAQTQAERQRGLSGSAPLADDQAMLFVFPSDGKWGFWMKDMNYPIDIIWLDQHQVVRHIAENAQPGSYPDITFAPPVATRYVIETKAGIARAKRITIGTQADISGALEMNK